MFVKTIIWLIYTFSIEKWLPARHDELMTWLFVPENFKLVIYWSAGLQYP